MLKVCTEPEPDANVVWLEQRLVLVQGLGVLPLGAARGVCNHNLSEKINLAPETITRLLIT